MKMQSNALLFGIELGEAEEFTLSSTVFPAAGYVVLDTSYVYAFPAEYEARLPDQVQAERGNHGDHE